MNRRTTPLIVKASGASGEFSGLASTWQRDRAGHQIARGAFAKSIASGHPIAMLWQHRNEEPIGAWRELRETEEGLAVRGQLTLAVPRAQEALALLTDGALSLSVGFQVPPGGLDVSTDQTLIREAELVEISLVSVPANPGAVVTSVKQLQPPELEQWFRAQGFSARQAKRLVAAVRQDSAEAATAEAHDLNNLAAALEAARGLF